MLLALTVSVFYTFLAILVALLVLLLLAKSLLGIVVIGELEVGIVAKKFARTSLAAGRLIALEGEAGLQADTLAPGWPGSSICVSTCKQEHFLSRWLTLSLSN